MTPSRSRSAATFIPVIAAYAIASWCLAALAWDGAGYLFNSLQENHAVISHHRYSNFPILLAVVEAGQFTDNARALGVLYGLVLSLTPVGSLLLSFHFLQKPPLDELRVWFALGILWGALPGEICLMSEASLAVQAFWPIVAFIAAGCPLSASGWLLILVPYIFFLHPTAALMFGMASAFCVGLAVANRERRPTGIRWGVVFASLAALRFGYAMMTATPYEKAELAFETNRLAAVGAIWRWPTGLLLAFYAFGGALLASAAGKLSPALARRIWIASGAVFLGIGIWWASDSKLWAGAISYRRFVFLCSLPIAAMVAMHWLLLKWKRGVPLPEWTTVFVALVFAVIYIEQSLSWRSDIVRLEKALASSREPFVTLETEPWMKHRALDHWGTTMLSAILQGRKPRVLYAESRNHIRDGNVQMFPNGWLVMSDGWFQLSARESSPAHESDPTLAR